MSNQIIQEFNDFYTKNCGDLYLRNLILKFSNELNNYGKPNTSQGICTLKVLTQLQDIISLITNENCKKISNDKNLGCSLKKANKKFVNDCKTIFQDVLSPDKISINRITIKFIYNITDLFNKKEAVIFTFNVRKGLIISTPSVNCFNFRPFKNSQQKQIIWFKKSQLYSQVFTYFYLSMWTQTSLVNLFLINRLSHKIKFLFSEETQNRLGEIIKNYQDSSEYKTLKLISKL